MIRGPIRSAIQNTKRAAEVIAVLARYGFESVVAETGLRKLLKEGQKLLPGAPAPDVERLSEAARLRLVLEELGPTFIKLGQILSTRPDLIPPDLVEEFKKLQDNCPKVEFELIQKRLDEEFAGETGKVFSHVSKEPLAAASIAQTHRATLQTGERVVLKVMRPGIERLIESDMTVLSDLAKLAERYMSGMGFEPRKVVREFAKQLAKETDFMNEGRALDRFRANFEDEPNVSFPKVYWEATTKRVLAMQEIEGMLLSRRKKDDLSEEKRLLVAQHSATAVFRMCLEHGFFHADPHPGNIFALESGAVCFIDCGMTGHIEKRTRDHLSQLVAAVIDSDLDKVVRIVLQLADGDTAFEKDRSFRADAWDIVTRFQTGSLADLDLAALLNSFFETLREYKIMCPSDLMFLIKALTTIQGVGEEIAPRFDLVAHVHPLVENAVRDQYGFSALKRRLERSALGYVELAEGFPYEARALAVSVRRRDFKVPVDIKKIDHLTEAINQGAEYISIALILSATIVGSSILILSDQGKAWGVFAKFGLVTLIAAGVFVIQMILRTAQARHKTRR